MPVGVELATRALMSARQPILRLDDIARRLPTARPKVVRETCRRAPPRLKFIGFGPTGWLYVRSARPATSRARPRPLRGDPEQQPTARSGDLRRGVRNSVGFDGTRERELWLARTARHARDEVRQRAEPRAARRMHVGYPYCHAARCPSQFAPRAVQRVHAAAQTLGPQGASRGCDLNRHAVPRAWRGKYHRERSGTQQAHRLPHHSVRSGGNRGSIHAFANGWLQGESRGAGGDVMVATDGSFWSPTTTPARSTNQYSRHEEEPARQRRHRERGRYLARAATGRGARAPGGPASRQIRHAGEVSPGYSPPLPRPRVPSRRSMALRSTAGSSSDARTRRCGAGLRDAAHCTEARSAQQARWCGWPNTAAIA